MVIKGMFHEVGKFIDYQGNWQVSKNIRTTEFAI